MSASCTVMPGLCREAMGGLPCEPCSSGHFQGLRTSPLQARAGRSRPRPLGRVREGEGVTPLTQLLGVRPCPVGLFQECKSYKWKLLLFLFNLVTFSLAVCIYFRHSWYCEAGGKVPEDPTAGPRITTFS